MKPTSNTGKGSGELRTARLAQVVWAISRLRVGSARPSCTRTQADASVRRGSSAVAHDCNVFPAWAQYRHVLRVRILSPIGSDQVGASSLQAAARLASLGTAKSSARRNPRIARARLCGVPSSSMTPYSETLVDSVTSLAEGRGSSSAGFLR